MGELRMPSLGADMEAGTLVGWRIHVGDSVKYGDIVADVETEKSLVEIECFESGVVEEIVVKEGEKVPVGTVLARFRAEGAAGHREPQQASAAAPPPAAIPETPPPAPVAAPSTPPPVAPIESRQRRPRISPHARRRAEELGVDLTTVRPGVSGTITAVEVERAAESAKHPSAPPVTAVPLPAPSAAPPAAPTRASAEQMAAMRHAIAAAMARSKREIPHYYLSTTIDMSRTTAWLQAGNLKRPVTERLLPSVLLLRAVALAAREVPEMNGFWVDGSFRPANGIHVGMAVSLRTGGLVAPAIHDVDRLSVDELSKKLLDLVKRARAGVLRSSEISDATITVTSLGDQGVESVFGVIYPPQVALVGFGKLTEQPRAVQGMIGIHPVITATLAGDHRASDGHRGGRFLALVDQLLQEPEKL